MKQAKATIVSAIEALPQTYLFRLKAPEIAAAARPGQFLMVHCGEDTLLRRPISIHRRDGDTLDLLVSVVGKGTAWLAQRKKGDSLDIFGPLGNGFTIAEDAVNLLLVAGGIGVAPLRFLAEEALGQGRKVTLLLGARTGDCILPITAPQALYEQGMLASDFNTVNATDDGSEGYKGPATGLIPAYLKGVKTVYACGPAAMYKTMAAMPELRDRKVQVSLEIMMACGTGACLGCTIKTKQGLKQVCKDGPVFDIRDVVWESFGTTG